MKRQKKMWIRKISAILFVVLILAVNFSVTVQAGFGDFNDYDYGGGSDWDFDSGSDWSYDYDSGSDWSYDSGSSWDGGYSSSGSFSAEDMGSLIWLMQGAFSGFPIAWLLIGAIVVGLLRKRMNGVHATTQGTSYSKPPVQKKTKILPDRTSEISLIIQENDPTFTAPDFISFARQVYVDIQDAWMKRDLEPVRGVLHQNLYQQTQKQIDKKIADGIVNYLERISVNTAYLTSYRRDAEYEYLTVYLAASMIDYQVREATGEVLYGDKTTRWNLKYKMTFVRTNGMASHSAQEKDEGFVCPNCGAPLKGTSFGKCEYCDSIVTTGVYDWVLSSFGVVKEDTVDEGIVY